EARCCPGDPRVPVQTGGEELAESRRIEAGVGDVGEVATRRVEDARLACRVEIGEDVPGVTTALLWWASETLQCRLIEVPGVGVHLRRPVEPVVEIAGNEAIPLFPGRPVRLEMICHRRPRR